MKSRRNLRKVLRKGTSFDGLAQETVDLVVSHVNSLIRKEYGDKSAAGLFKDKFGQKVLAALRVTEIPAADVCLTPPLAGLPN